jgi:hypothetical protein
MKISGFTIIKNAVINDYPIIEAITSILPVVDEMIVLIGDSSDSTIDLIQSIQSDKIKIHHSVWDKRLKKGGEVLAVETNKAFQLIDPKSTWAFYIQADEAVHEKDHPAILDACHKYKNDKRVEGLLFKYLHFYGTYDYIGDSRKWYRNEVRIIRNDKKILSYKDAQGFRVGERKLNVKAIDAPIYHYGWVKSQEQMQSKIKEVSKYWNNNIPDMDAYMKAADVFDFSDIDSLNKYEGVHPAVMKQRIQSKNWQLNFDVNTKKFATKDKVLYWIEKVSGIRLFEFKNYKLIR